MQTLQKMALAIAVIVLTFGTSAATTSAQVSSLLIKPFGGLTTSFSIPSTPVCPYTHTAVDDFVTGIPIGIMVIPGSQIYQYGNLYLPGIFVLGNLAPTPLVCPGIPYFIYPIISIGTGLTPFGF